MEENIEQEVHDEALTTVHTNSSSDVSCLKNIKEEVLLAEPDIYVNTSGDLTIKMEMKENIEHEVHDEISATNSSCDISSLNNIKEEVLLVEPNTYVHNSEDLTIKMEMEVDIKCEIVEEAVSTINADPRCVISFLNKMEDEFPPAEPEAQVKQEISTFPTFCFELKSETLDQKCAVKTKDDDISMRLKSIANQELDIKTEGQSSDAGQMTIQRTGDKSFLCTICDHNYSTKSNLQQHMKIHTGEKPFQCDMCSYKCLEKTNLQRHMKIHTGEKPFQCTICDHKCSLKVNLQNHMKIHTGERPFQCALCDYKCYQENSLQRHMKSHTGEKPFQCTLCDRKCSEKIKLQRHLKSHTGEKPFQCALCDRKCSEKSSLKKHMKIHTGEKPFKCAVCNYKCSVKGNLQKHMRIHTGEKPFQCGLCDYKCSEKSNLYKHMERHTGKKLCNV